MWFGKDETKKQESIIELIGGPPQIIMTPEVYADQMILVDEHPQELGWEGSVTRTRNEFRINQIFLIGQGAGASTCTLSTTGQTDVGTEILMSPNPEVFDTLFLWGHSHVHFPVEGSSQDDNQLEILASRSVSGYFIRVIINKHGEIEFTIQFSTPTFSFIARRVPWIIIPEATDIRREHWRAEIMKKVSAFGHYSPPASLSIKLPRVIRRKNL